MFFFKSNPERVVSSIGHGTPHNLHSRRLPNSPPFPGRFLETARQNLHPTQPFLVPHHQQSVHLACQYPSHILSLLRCHTRHLVPLTRLQFQTLQFVNLPLRLQPILLHDQFRRFRIGALTQSVLPLQRHPSIGKRRPFVGDALVFHHVRPDPGIQLHPQPLRSPSGSEQRPPQCFEDAGEIGIVVAHVATQLPQFHGTR
mmetsp:Transcript_30482/g.37103  ORF Transcript_30482/g.37103 Transcript_30482/m.37103 type:complete len:200 (+) Transcript_30482:172-771(+)